MTLPSLARLLALAAIWGGGFLFIRMGAPILGPTILIEYRVGLAAIFLFFVALVLHKPLHLKQHWKHFLILGIFNAALPFTLFGYAALTLTASSMSILNATSPIWGAVINAVWMRHPLNGRTMLGLSMGVVGVALIVGFDHLAEQKGAGLAIAATLLATFCYGLATNYTNLAKPVDSFSNAHGSMWAASLLILPALPFASAPATPNLNVMLAVVALGIVCTGIAFLLYFRLVKDIGGTSTLTVTFLIPVFGILWGHLFLDEVITPSMIVGSLVVVSGTALATGFNPLRMLTAKKSSAN